jgi:predicted metal-dependent HD superfamily phosphohydrolase
MRDRWTQLCRRLGAAGDPDLLFELLSALYSHPPRAYHNLGHISACLAAHDDVRDAAADADAVEFALWLHDAVYFPGRPDNETRSADVADMCLIHLRAEPRRVAPVRGLILATRHTGAPLQGDAALVADIDMSILAAPPEAYARYATAIRAEYADLDDDAFHAGRAAFLRKLLARPALFYSDLLHQRLEDRGRRNVADEVARLGV